MGLGRERDGEIDHVQWGKWCINGQWGSCGVNGFDFFGRMSGPPFERLGWSDNEIKYLDSESEFEFLFLA